MCNSALIFDRDGDLHGTYDKVRSAQHDLMFEAGRELPVLPVTLGPSAC